MRLLVDEDLPRSLVQFLRDAGIEAQHVVDLGLRGRSDDEIFDHALAGRLTLLSADMGFGNILRYPLGSHSGIVVARFPNELSPLPRNWPRRVRSAVVHTIALAHTSLTHARSVAANSINARIRLKEESDRLRNEILLLQEESRIKDARMEQIPAHRRPHYPPTERLTILEHRAAHGWSLAQTARRFLITTATVASWMHRLDEEGPAALVQTSEPMNKFPEFVGYIVRRLKLLCPTMGKIRIANVLCRAGLHLGPMRVAPRNR